MEGTKKDFLNNGYEYLIILAKDIGEEFVIR